MYIFLFISAWPFSHTIFRKKSQEIVFKGKNDQVKLVGRAAEKAKYIWVVKKSNTSMPNDLKNKVSKKLAKSQNLWKCPPI